MTLEHLRGPRPQGESQYKNLIHFFLTNSFISIWLAELSGGINEKENKSLWTSSNASQGAEVGGHHPRTGRQSPGIL